MTPSAFSFLLEPYCGPALEAAALSADDALLWRACVQAREGVGRTAPNPAVGAAVLADSGDVVLGHHARAGERHAEIVALDQIGDGARDATLAVTLEPCVHHGRTPPCVDRILSAGVQRVVVGAVDQNPRVRNQGIAALRAQGLDVRVANGPVAEHCEALARPFFTHVLRQRPYVVLKTATSLDGRVATRGGASRWITGPDARRCGHSLRNRCDAVMAGSGTVRMDDPELTVREVPAGSGTVRDPVRVLVDSALTLDPDARAIGQGTLLLTASSDPARSRIYEARGCSVLSVPAPDGRVDLVAGLAALAARGIVSLLVEGGPTLATALWQAGLWDELWWFTAPTLLGADGIAAMGPLGLAVPAEAPRPLVAHRAVLGDDALTVLLPPPR